MKRMIPLLFAAMLVCLVSWPPSALAGEGEQEYGKKRALMVEKDLKARGIGDRKVLDAMGRVKRHLLVPPALAGRAYEDNPLPIGEGQTISQPYVVALMTEALCLTGDEKVLEVGTGSGYQAAVLAEIVKEVCTIEIIENLSRTAEEKLAALGYRNIRFRTGDGYAGWDTYAPFDAIIITAAARHIPPRLLAQLKEGGRLIMPLGNGFFSQSLTLVTKSKGKFTTKRLGGVVFVPMRGEVEKW